MKKSSLDLVLYFFIIFIGCQNLLSSTEQYKPYCDNKVDGRNCKIAIVCVFKNEAEWLKEWIEYHKMIGVTHFYLYNNLSTDHYLDVLNPYIVDGSVELFNYPATPFLISDQNNIYNHAIDLAKKHSKWLVIIDTDEFVAPVETNNLELYLDQFPDHVAGIEINWQTYGTSNIKFLKANELLIEKLVFRAPFNDPVNLNCKSIVKPDHCRCKSPHECVFNPGFISLHDTANSESDLSINEKALSKIRINHYVWRTEDFFYSVKLPRIDQRYPTHFNAISAREFLNQSNSVLDDCMKDFIQPLKAIMFPEKNKSF